eukprot:10882777-Heterocapsa_arctica.AAC.1
MVFSYTVIWVRASTSGFPPEVMLQSWFAWGSGARANAPFAMAPLATAGGQRATQTLNSSEASQ